MFPASLKALVPQAKARDRNQRCPRPQALWTPFGVAAPARDARASALAKMALQTAYVKFQSAVHFLSTYSTKNENWS